MHFVFMSASLDFREMINLMFLIGAGFSSKSKYMFGKVTVQIKLVEGDSAGTVTAFYVSLISPFHTHTHTA